jgi:DNA-binding transcriptional LysR family regulator
LCIARAKMNPHCRLAALVFIPANGDLRAGRLVPLLRAFEVPPLGLQAIYPKGRAQVRRIKMLLDALTAGFAGGGLGTGDGLQGGSG